MTTAKSPLAANPLLKVDHLTMRFGGLVAVNNLSFEARRGDVRLQLTPTGYTLLAALLRAAPRIVSRDALEQEVWGDDRPDSDALRTHIHALRLALDRPFERALLKTQPGIGYRLVDGDD